MIERILPDSVAVAESFDDPADAYLYPEEAVTVARAVEKRRREFTTGRHCARRALVRLGRPAGPLPAGERGAPRWPAGVVGSITHCEGYRGAAVAPVAVIASLGIDSEPHGELPDGVLGAISLPAERDWLARRNAESGDIRWDRLLFCAKEAVYKAWYPLTRRWLGFADAEVSVAPDADPHTGRFTARLLVPAPPPRQNPDTPEGPGGGQAPAAEDASQGSTTQGATTQGPRRLTGFEGRWLVAGGLVLTAVAVAAGAVHGGVDA